MSDTHNHSLTSFNFKVLMVLIINAIFIVIEFAYGFVLHSSTLVADAGHNLIDVLGIFIFLISSFMYDKNVKSESFTYGLKPFSIVSTLINTLLIAITLIFVFTDSIEHFFHNTMQETSWFTVFVIGGIAFIINLGSSFIFFDQSHDVNKRSVFIHLFADALGSAVVMFSAVLIAWTKWLYWDPVMGLGIFMLIFLTSMGNFKDVGLMLMNAVPRHVNITNIRQWLQLKPGVTSIHSLHIWKISSKDTIFTVHLMLDPSVNPYETVQKLSQELKTNFHFQYVTIQVENNNYKI